MALTILVTPAAGDIIQSSVWINEFNNIYNNPVSLISPLTGTVNLNSQTLSGAATFSGAITFSSTVLVTTIDIGNADTTVSRSAAGKIAVEGIDAVLLSGAQTLTDKTLTAPVINGTVTTTGLTLPAFTLGGTIAGGANQINNVIIGTSSPLAGTFTTGTFNTSIKGPTIYGGGAAGSTLNLKGTDNGAPVNAHILLNSANEGYVSIGTTLADTNLHIGGLGTTVGAIRGHLVIDDSTSVGADVGGGVIFDGYVITTTTKSDFGGIRGGKENGTSGNTAGYLAFFTQAAAGTLAEAARFSSTKQLVFSSASSGALLQFPSADQQILMGGTTDPGWSVPAIQLNAGSSIFSPGSANGINVNFNCYYDGDFKYIATTSATRFVSDGNMTFQGAPSGTAGNAITFTTIMQLVGGGGVTIGAAPTGGQQGAGTLNVDTNVYLDGNAYANPDYVLEHFFTGKIVEFADRDGAKEYAGLRSLDMVESLSRQYNTLPLVYEARQRNKDAEGNARLGIFDGGDAVLASVEESFLHLFDHEKRLRLLEEKLINKE